MNDATQQKLTPQAVALLERVKERILAQPQEFNMDGWVYPSDESPCGTTACIAGWCVHIATGMQLPAMLEALDAESLFVWEEAEKLLLNGKRAENCELDALFHVEYWPEPFRTRYQRAQTPFERALVAARRIDHFVQADGAE